MSAAYYIPDPPAVQMQLCDYEAEHDIRYVEQLPTVPSKAFATIPWESPFQLAASDHVLASVPQAFWTALADFHAGRVVDIETALNQRPPDA